MTGHWEYDGEYMFDKKDMWDLILESGHVDELDLEGWIDDEYTASEIFSKFGFAIHNSDKPLAANDVYNELYDEFLSYMYGKDEPTEGEDFEFCGLVFKWAENNE